MEEGEIFLAPQRVTVLKKKYDSFLFDLASFMPAISLRPRNTDVNATK
jgi:hypothetical protein